MIDPYKPRNIDARLRADFRSLWTQARTPVAPGAQVDAETHQPAKRRKGSSGTEDDWPTRKSPFLSSWFVGHLTVLIAVQLGVYGYLSASPYLVIDLLGYQPFHFGYVFIYLTCGYLLGNAFSGWGLLNSGGLLACGIFSYGIGGAVMLGLSLNGVVSLYSIVAPALLLSLANGISQPQCMAAALSVAPRRRGAASSIVSFSQIMAGGVGFRIVGWLPGGSPAPMTIVICVCALLGAGGLLMIFCRPPSRFLFPDDGIDQGADSVDTHLDRISRQHIRQAVRSAG